MQIRRVTSGDWEQLRTIRLAALADAPDAFSSTFEHEVAWPSESWRMWAASSDAGDRQATFIAEGTGAWLGIATGAVHRWRAGAILYAMWVDPDARRQGVGRQLVEAVVAWARSRDLPAIWLWVADGNEPAVALYATLGFVRSGRIESDAHELVLPLTELPAPPDGPLADFHLGTLAILLPEPLTTRVGELRRRFDPVSAAVAPPHITLTQPLAVPLTEARLRRITDIAGSFPSFDIGYGPARTFADSAVVYLAVEPADRLEELRGRLHGTGWFRLDLPHTDDFVPHITIREFGDPNAIPSDDLRERLDAAVGSGSFRCTDVAVLVTRSGLALLTHRDAAAGLSAFTPRLREARGRSRSGRWAWAGPTQPTSPLNQTMASGASVRTR